MGARSPHVKALLWTCMGMPSTSAIDMLNATRKEAAHALLPVNTITVILVLRSCFLSGSSSAALCNLVLHFHFFSQSSSRLAVNSRRDELLLDRLRPERLRLRLVHSLADRRATVSNIFRLRVVNNTDLTLGERYFAVALMHR